MEESKEFIAEIKTKNEDLVISWENFDSFLRAVIFQDIPEFSINYF